MNSTKHTPGPWKVIVAESDESDVPTAFDIFPLNSDRFIATTGEANPGEELECAANGALIAAAPELLAAVGYLLTIIARNSPEMDSTMNSTKHTPGPWKVIVAESDESDVPTAFDIFPLNSEPIETARYSREILADLNAATGRNLA